MTTKTNSFKYLRNIIIVSALILSSCVNTKNVPYFKDVGSTKFVVGDANATFVEPTIQSDDILAISIFTIDAATSMAVNQLATQTLNYGPAGAQSNSTSGFLVNKQGEVYLSIIGKVKLSGLTTSQAIELIKQKASVVYVDPNVQVRFANFKVTVLGEVNKPASYVLPNEKISVLDAIGMAGDLTIFGRRENVLLIRENNGRKEFTRLDLNSKELFTSPAYYLKQNDVIYIEPTVGKSAANNASRTQTIAIIASLISVAISVITRL
jgi:polysaccharide export outer membrane protein